MTTCKEESQVPMIPVADGAEGFKNEMEGCIHTLKNGYQKASAREFIHMLHQSTAIWKTMGE